MWHKSADGNVSHDERGRNMKITAVGVNSAFGTGEYENVISAKQACEIAFKIANSPEFEGASKKVIESVINKLSQCRYKPKWQSNFLIEFDMPSKRGEGPYRLLVDVGGDIRHALKGLGLSSTDIDGVYISHPHNDHIGGMEYLGLTTLFNPFYTPAKKNGWVTNLLLTNYFSNRNGGQVLLPMPNRIFLFTEKCLSL